jgi:alpha-L-rhamnosidase
LMNHRLAAAMLAVASVAGTVPHVRAEVAPADLTAGQLRCEYLTDPIGMDEPRPRLSWTLAAEGRGAKQSAYEVAVATSTSLLDGGHPDLWDSGKVASGEQNGIEYAGRPLAARQACAWRVRAWDGADHAGPWSPTATWEVGLTAPADWSAKWIADGPPPPGAGKATILSATYEAVGRKPAKRDVTDLVKGLVRDGSLELTVDNPTLGGDPAQDKHKQLVVRYSIDGRPPEEVTFRENSRVYLPDRPPQVLRRAFRVDRPVVRARLYATALGLYDLRVNGRPVTESVFNPEWTDYRKRVRYQAYDVTPLIHPGGNAIGGTVANGFYSGHIANGGFQFWGTQPCVMAQLELTHDDGSVDRVCTDEQWRSHAGPLRSADVMGGEEYDARAALDASDPDLADDGKWTPAVIRTTGLTPVISAQVAPPIRELMTLRPKAVSEPTPGHYVFDLGQNMVGVARIRVTAPAGTAVTVRFAEMLNPDKTIYTDNYRGARSTDTYTCRGGGQPEVWQPTFTYHGFRYVELTGLPAAPDTDAVVGVVQGSDTPSVGTFTCSDPRINQLWSNARWGQRGNFFGVPTDCPQRDERLGWMGDAQVFIGTAVYNADVASFFTKWLVDVDDEQHPDGRFTSTAPDTSLVEGNTPGWADAGVICPWTLYATYGDRRELARHLPAMERWVDWCEQHSTGLIRDKDRGSDFGDWLAIGAKTSKELLGTAYFAHVADLVARSADATGDPAAAAKYAELFRRIKAAFAKRYLAPDGSIVDGTQTAYAMALAFDLLPGADRPAAAARLAADVQAHGDHLTTGFLGVSYLLPALSDHAQADTAYRLLMQDTFPSWLFSIKHGATTIWERWDGWTPDKGFQSKGMNSFNHYSLGSCGQWLYARVAGIDQPPGGTGFTRVRIAPLVGGGGLTSASASYDSIRGTVRSAWRLADGQLSLEVTVPANVTATVRVPTANPDDVRESGQPAADVVHRAGAEPGAAATFEVGSGTYHFTAAAPAVEAKR